jgi:hypothetical protein
MSLYFHDVLIGNATGFIYSFGQDLALVSNWHVFSGIHPEHGIVRHHTGYTPNRVEFHISITTSTEAGLSIGFRALNVPLQKAGVSLWWQHGGYVDGDGVPHHVDIGVLPLSELIEGYEDLKPRVVSFDAQVLVSQSDDPSGWSMHQGTARIGSEVFILGYPLGLASQGVIPIWKRGSLASEPLFNINGNIPIVYVDALTREGMSGSPVVYLGTDIIDEEGRTTGEREGAYYQPWLVGIYSGRWVASADESEMALGRVWKKYLLDEIFFQRVPGGSALGIPNIKTTSP